MKIFSLAYLKEVVSKDFNDTFVFPVLLPYIVGFCSHPYIVRHHYLREFIEDLIPEFIITVLTISILERFSDSRSREAKITSLYRKSYSQENLVALSNLEEIKVSEFAAEGESVLENRDLKGADWTNADLKKFSLRNSDLRQTRLVDADLSFANLEGVLVASEQLAVCKSLRGARMPDGSRYDGRFRLAGDLHVFNAYGFDQLDPAKLSPETAAKILGVDLAVYTKGQQWAEDNLPIIRARLDKELVN